VLAGAVAETAPAAGAVVCFDASCAAVSWAAAAAAAPVAATAETVTRPVTTVSRRTARSRAWGVWLRAYLERVTVCILRAGR